MLFDFLKNLISPITNLIDELHTSGEEKAAAKAKLVELISAANAQVMEAETKFAELQSRVIIAEAQGSSWLQRNWRPVLMMTFTAILANNFILAPYFSALTHGAIKVLEFPTAFWGLLTVGVGGYIAGRTFEKIKGVDGITNGNGG
jgi:hypothetical protein